MVIRNNNDNGTHEGYRIGAAGADGQDRARRLEFAMRALGRTPVSIFYQSEFLVYQWAENIPHGLGIDSVEGKADADFLPRLAADRLTAVKQKVLASGEPHRFELPINLSGEVRWFDVWVDPETNLSGRVIGIFSTLIEMTDQKRREVQLKNLLREVSHRSKNLLAIILSLASQTARSSTSLPAFVNAFSGRLQAISRAQDLVTDRDWRGALLSDLIERQVALFRGDRALPVTVGGEDLVIAPNAALYVGLAIHELCANAARNRHLIAAAGHIDVIARIEPGKGDSRVLVLEWIERGVGDHAEEEMEQLSKAFLENVVPLAVDGSGAITHEPTGMRYQLRIDGVHIA